jgi:predicted transcriptional regulator
MADSLSNIELAAEITSAYVSNNSVRVTDLPGLFGEIHSALVRISSGAAVIVAPEAQMPYRSRNRSPATTLFVWRTAESLSR